MAKLISTQKVIKAIEKAGLSYDGGSRGTGYYAYKSFADSPEITVGFRFGRFSKYGSHTLARIEKLAAVAKVLSDAGMPVYMSAKLGDHFDGNLYVWRNVDTDASARMQTWNTYILKDVYAEKIEAEISDSKEVQRRKEETEAKRARLADEALELAKKQNPQFTWQMITAAGAVRSCEVYYNDGRRAILTIFVGATKGRYGMEDWDVVDLKIAGLEQDRRDSGKWDTVRSEIVGTQATETVEDLLWAWLSRQ